MGAVQHLISEKDELLEMIKPMKKDIATMKGKITKLKKKITDALPGSRASRRWLIITIWK